MTYISIIGSTSLFHFMTQEDILGELGDVILGKAPARESEDEIIVYDATGTAIQDTATAVTVYEKAVKEGAGFSINLFE